MCVCVLCQCICVCRYLYLHLYLYLHTHRICCRCSLLLCMFFLCPERQQGLPNASSSRAIIIDTPQVVSPSVPFPFSLLSLLLSLYLSPFSARLFTFVIVAVVLNLASYCLAVSVAVAVPVRVPSAPFSSHRIYSVFVHKRRPQKEPKTMGDKGHSGRELLLCLWRGSNGDGVRPGAGEGGKCSGRCRYVAVTLSGRFHTDTGRQWQQQRQQLYKSQTCDCLARQELPQPVPDPSARPVRVPVSVHSSRFPFLLLLAQRYPVKV